MRSFLFVEIKDGPAVDVLTRLRNILRSRESRSPIHITVRGPYKNRPAPEKLESLWHVLEGEGLLLHGIGRFEFPEKDVVFLRSHSKAIRKIWWKRDYPIIRYGFNPHITLFEGPTAQAKKVETFLRGEGIELFCRKLSLTLYETPDDDLFSEPVKTELHASKTSKVSPLVNSYRWEDGLLDRAKSVIESIK